MYLNKKRKAKMKNKNIENTIRVILDKISAGKLVSLVITTVLIIFVLISMTPIISWVGGVAGLLSFGMLMVISRFKFLSQEPFPKKTVRKWIRLSTYSILFGVVFYTGCRIQSAILVNTLIEECASEQKITIKNITNSPPPQNVEKQKTNK